MAKKELNIMLGERVRETRRSLKMTREQLAEKINISVRFLADVEGGAVGVSLSTLKELCMALNVCSDYLIGNYDKPLKDEYSVAMSKLGKIPPEYLCSAEIILDEIIKMSDTAKS